MNVRYIMQVEEVLNKLSSDYIRFPVKDDEDGWRRISAGFQSRFNGNGHLDVAGAIDGTLLAINRPEYFEGFYCRKGIHQN